MELQILIGLLFIAVSILATGIFGWITMRKTRRDISEAIERAIKAIHEDIKASQEKLEQRIEGRE